MHLDEEQVQRLLSGELPGSEVIAVRAHLDACPECQARLAGAMQDASVVGTLLGHLDHPVPQVTADAIAARARGSGTSRFRWAAGILLALGAAGAAYAVPGSPVPRWVAAVAGWIQGREERPDHGLQTPRPAAPAIAGISVTPGPRFLIHFTRVQAAGHARVSLTKGTEVVVQGPMGAATFTSGMDRLVIANAGGAADFEVRIPDAAPWVEIRVGGDRVLLKEGARVTTADSASSAPFLLPLTSNGGKP